MLYLLRFIDIYEDLWDLENFRGGGSIMVGGLGGGGGAVQIESENNRELKFPKNRKYLHVHRKIVVDNFFHRTQSMFTRTNDSYYYQAR